MAQENELKKGSAAPLEGAGPEVAALLRTAMTGAGLMMVQKLGMDVGLALKNNLGQKPGAPVPPGMKTPSLMAPKPPTGRF